MTGGTAAAGVDSPGAGDAAAMIRVIWNNNRDDVMDRVASLEDAVASLIEGSLSPDTRLAAERDAHRLAGAAGTFGFRRASAAARELESILAGAYPIPLDRTLAAADEVVALRDDLGRDPDLVTAPKAGQDGAGSPANGSPSGPSVVIEVTSRRLRRQLTSAAEGLGLVPLAPDAGGSSRRDRSPPRHWWNSPPAAAAWGSSADWQPSTRPSLRWPWQPRRRPVSGSPPCAPEPAASSVRRRPPGTSSPRCRA
ncbi:Hpt domain-containing protein [Pseudarthrobacter sp. L19]|uniref:Hpt domain-containing protein n=1 Tax=Pseudarthrobacter sp. L19 TaxID=3423951 RepID=UPI003D7A2C6D